MIARVAQDSMFPLTSMVAWVAASLTDYFAQNNLTYYGVSILLGAFGGVGAYLDHLRNCGKPLAPSIINGAIAGLATVLTLAEIVGMGRQFPLGIGLIAAYFSEDSLALLWKAFKKRTES